MILDYTEFVEESSEEIHEDFFSPTALQIQTRFFQDLKRQCKYCRCTMVLPINHVQDLGGSYDSVHQLFDCPQCGWWWEHELQGTYMGEGDTLSSSTYRFSILRKFRAQALDLPIASLRLALKDNPTILTDLHPTKLEQLVGSVFRDHLDCDVTHVGRSGDGGIDLLLVTGDQQWVVQVKRRQNTGAVEGVKPIRELIGSMVVEQYRKGIFVTTASRFTRGARVTAGRAAIVGAVEKIQLIDINSFINLLQLTNHQNERPWMIAAQRSSVT